MATDLRTGLGDLASHTPPASPPTDLWARGVRRRRVTRAGSAVLVAALVLVLGVGAWSWQTARQRLEPVAPHGAARLPDQVFTPSPWLRTFDGAPGPLVAITTAEQNHFWHRSTPGLVGITAGSGEYGFLDLPGAGGPATWTSSDLPVALSTDGRYVAYWVSGRPSSTPNTVQTGVPLVGVRVYDTVTGRARTANFETAHGIAPQSLLWTDSRTLVLDFGQISGGDDSHTLRSAAHDYRLEVWRLGAPRPQRLTPGTFAYGFGLSTAGDRWLVVTAPGRIVDPRVPGPLLRFRASNGSEGPLVVSPDLRQVARVVGQGTRHATLQVGRLHPVTSGRPEKTVFRRASPETHFYLPTAWTDGHHVVVSGSSTPGPDGTSTGVLDEVDVRTGDERTLVSGLLGGTGTGGTAYTFATGLLAAPTASAEPPHAVNPHLVLAGLVGLVLALLAIVGVWRRRRA